MTFLAILFFLIFLFCFIVTGATLYVLFFVKSDGEVNLRYEEDDEDGE